MPYSCSEHINLSIYGIWGNSLLDADNEYEYDANFMDILSKGKISNRYGPGRGTH